VCAVAPHLLLPVDVQPHRIIENLKQLLRLQQYSSSRYELCAKRRGRGRASAPDVPQGTTPSRQTDPNL
jgi:hypothetical protein